MDKTFRRCALCKNRYSLKTTKFFKVPLCDIKRQRWIKSCDVNFREHDIVCEYHFRAEDYVNGPREPKRTSGKTRLQPGAVPKMLEKCPKSMEVDTGAVPKLPKKSLESMEVDTGHKDCTTQTKDDFLQHSFRVEIMLSKQKYDQLEMEHAKLLKERKVLHSSLSKIFSKGQLDKLKNPDKKIMWSSEDVINAKDFLVCGIRAYKHIYNKGFPLPHISTLWKWIRDKRIDENPLCEGDMSILKSDDVEVQEDASGDYVFKDAPAQSNLSKFEEIFIQSMDRKKMQKNATSTSNGNVEKGPDKPTLSCDDRAVQESTSGDETYDSVENIISQGNTLKIEKVCTLALSQRKVQEDATSLNNLLQHEKVPILSSDDLKVHQDAMTSLRKLPKHIKVSILSVDGKREQQKQMLSPSTLPKLKKHLPVDDKKEKLHSSVLSNSTSLKQMPILSVEVEEEHQSAPLLSSSVNVTKESVLFNSETRLQQTTSKDATLLSISPKQDKVSILYIDVPNKGENASKVAISPRNLMREMPISLDDIMEEAYEFDLLNF